jgi:hypothetical protein
LAAEAAEAARGAAGWAKWAGRPIEGGGDLLEFTPMYNGLMFYFFNRLVNGTSTIQQGIFSPHKEVFPFQKGGGFFLLQ